MADEEARIDELLKRWRAGYDGGRDLPLDELCSADTDLANEVGRRIAALRESLVPGTTPPTPNVAPAPPPADAPATPLRFGSFVLGELIGQGGFGRVYRA